MFDSKNKFTLEDKLVYHSVAMDMEWKKYQRLSKAEKNTGNTLDKMIERGNFLLAVEFSDMSSIHGKEYEKDFFKKHPDIKDSKGFQRGLAAYKYDKFEKEKELKSRYQKELKEKQKQNGSWWQKKS